MNNEIYTAALEALLDNPGLNRNEVIEKIMYLRETERRGAPEPPKPKHWPGYYDPLEGGEYFVVCSAVNGLLAYKRTNGDQSYTDADRALGICCETKEEAEFVIKQKKAERDVRDLLEKKNEGWRPDWESTKQDKWEAFKQGAAIRFQATACQTLRDCFQAMTEEVWEEVIEELGEEKVRLALWPKFEAT